MRPRITAALEPTGGNRCDHKSVDDCRRSNRGRHRWHSLDQRRPWSLKEWLTRLDETAQLYATQARSFTCDETIQWDRKGETGRRKFGYVVVLDENGNFDDYRTRLKKRKVLAPLKRVKPDDYQVPPYLRSAYLWSFIFRRDRWPYHRYEIVGQEYLKDRPAVILRFEPIPPYSPSVNNWFGAAWIDAETAQIVRIVAHRPEDQQQIEAIARHKAGEAVSDWVYVIEEITTNFDVEERGMRFPGSVELRQLNYDFLRSKGITNSHERTVLWVKQKYSNYQFFGVLAEDSIELVPSTSRTE